ncbi:hypothetical protein NQ315_006465 [Exocentrus adspersus]|uniref:Telomeric repeat-binding factor 2-interacting protein 1 n=1 Tax=Exocentrus adspersus TaxID=1586481 RepID=A0AAV8W018_9CUCU|nr:hypothetical protein NQ315_006465 [Exocentrus adspersus]
MSGYRPLYTIEEDHLILQMIIETGAYYRLRGKQFWVDLSNTGILDRTWMSLKEHYEKYILPKIFSNQYSISRDEKQKLVLAGYQHNNFTADSNDQEDDDQSEEQRESNAF